MKNNKATEYKSSFRSHHCAGLSEEKDRYLYISGQWLPSHDPTHLRNHLQQNFRKQMPCQVTTGKQKVFKHSKTS